LAGRLTDAERDNVVDALAGRFDVDIHQTTARDVAMKVAHSSVEAGSELVIAFGGDGHVNEVANGLAGTESVLGIIPGGTMNVFARALGIPVDPFAAIENLERRQDGPARRVSLGLMDDRYFTFSAGCGFDAEAAALVERDMPRKRRFGEIFFYWSAFRVLATSYRHRDAVMTVKGSFGEERVAMAIGCNAGPYAYLRGRPIELAPHVRLQGRLDLFAMRTMRIEALPMYAWRCLVSGNLVRHHDVLYRSDLDAFEIEAEVPFARHVDGEPLLPSTSARFSIEPDVLKVLA
jgi:diacylglycerol kinase family enzyme